jgi:hypothetical protein
MHINPGEILDFLMVFPYLKEGAVVVFHDTCLHTIPNITHSRNAMTTCLCMSALKGQKIIAAVPDEEHPFSNIGAVILDKDSKDRIFDVFNLLILHWGYKISQEDYETAVKHFERFYPEELVNIFKIAYTKQAEMMARREGLLHPATPFLKILCLLTPIKSWRKTIRSWYRVSPLAQEY